MQSKFLDILKTQVANGADNLFEPYKFRLSELKNATAPSFEWIDKPGILINDSIEDQIIDLVKLRSPERVLSAKEIEGLVVNELGGLTLEEYGVWVYYPWKHCVVHLLDEKEFVEVRTVRNKHKITHAEQEQLQKKSIGIIGLSVGQSVATTIAMERIAGTIKLTDFDVLELSNLNRIRTGVMNLGVPKCIAVAREIAEIDPFLKIEIYPNGINADNIEHFFKGEPNLDLLIEESDSMEIKLLSRKYARKYQIPVVMDTSDSLLLDIERFDLDPNRPILHGLVPENWDEISIEERKQLAFRVIELERVSERGKESISQIGKTITTWPQLATDVIAGGAIAAKFVREILLGQDIPSGRSRFDLLEHHQRNARFKS